MEPDQKIKKQMLGISVLSILGVVILILVIVSLAKNRSLQKIQPSSDPNVAINPQTQKEAPTGTLGMTIQGGRRTYSKGEKITFFVYADSFKKEIEAYDIVLRYSKNNLKLEQVSSSISGVDIYDTEEQISETHSELIITGVKDLSNQTKYIFNKTALVELTFSALASGDAEITLVYEKGSKRDSNLIDTRNNDILNTVLSESVKIN